MPPSPPCRIAELILGCLRTVTYGTHSAIRTLLGSVIGHVLQNVLVALSQTPHNTEVGSTNEHTYLSLRAHSSAIAPILMYTTDLESLESHPHYQEKPQTLKHKHFDSLGIIHMINNETTKQCNTTQYNNT